MPSAVALTATLALALPALGVVPSGGLVKTPPMGWMSWEIFRCNTDCAKDPNNCLSQSLYTSMTDALAAKGADGKSFVAAGYNAVHMDDCWPTKTRDSKGRLQPDPKRFPLGIAALASYVHARGVKLGIYSDAGTHTCMGYPGSEGYEVIDVSTFSSWGVDYLKYDGCYNNQKGYWKSYPAMGRALRAAGQRPISYSCSWPAYLGGNESAKPYAAMIASGCNLWRNYDDIQCNWGSLSNIIDHYGDYSSELQKIAGPSHWNDPDMLLIGNSCITDDEAETQMAIWGILAAPLIMGNDVRNINSARAREILLNSDAIAVDQDPLGRPGLRLTASGNAPTQVWARELTGGAVAVALYNKGGAGGTSADITVAFADLPGMTATSSYIVYDIWAQKAVGTFTGQYTAKAVALHGTAFLRVTPVV